MCTLIVLHRCVPGRPLVVAANRDEFLDRPAAGPALRMRDSGPILAPLDLEAGGTWLGLNGRGVFAGLTNLRPSEGLVAGPGPGSTVSVDFDDPERCESSRSAGQLSDEALLASGPVGRPGVRSRGEVVMAALDAGSAADAVAAVGKLEEYAYNPFQLLVADSQRAWLTVYRDRPRSWALKPGVHVVGNVEDEREDERDEREEEEREDERIDAVIGAAQSEPPDSGDSDQPRARKLTRIRERVEELLTESSGDLFENLAGICREHHVDEHAEDAEDAEDTGESGFESTCVHVAERYGTRSSLLLELADVPEASRLWATDGPPCERPFENLSALLKELDVRSRIWTRG